jgi:hypothetical protein
VPTKSGCEKQARDWNKFTRNAEQQHIDEDRAIVRRAQEIFSQEICGPDLATVDRLTNIHGETVYNFLKGRLEASKERLDGPGGPHNGSYPDCTCDGSTNSGSANNGGGTLTDPWFRPGSGYGRF